MKSIYEKICQSVLLSILAGGVAQANVDTFETSSQAYEQAQDVTDTASLGRSYSCYEFSKDGAESSFDYAGGAHNGQWSTMFCRRTAIGGSTHNLVVKDGKVVGKSTLLGGDRLNFRQMDNGDLVIEHVTSGQATTSVLAYSVCTAN